MYPHVCLASSLNVAYKLMLKHAKSRIYMGSHATGMTVFLAAIILICVEQESKCVGRYFKLRKVRTNCDETS